MNKNILVVLVAGGIIGALFFWNAKRNAPVSSPDATETGDMQGKPGGAFGLEGSDASESGDVGEGEKDGNEQTFSVEGKNFSFSQKEIRVKKGTRMTVVFSSTEGLHDWVVDEFSAKTKQVQAGDSDTVSFVADTSGTFEYYCSVGKHRSMGMVGKLIVE